MMINRIWSMPNKWTFKIEPVQQIIDKYITRNFIDPFAGNSIYKNYCTTNDLNKKIKADYNLCALDFLKQQSSSFYDGCLFDPPYSVRQIKECYENIGRKLTAEETKSSFISEIKNQVARVVKPGGVVISFGWNSNGLGLCRGFKIIEILLIAHGGSHYDTIITVEQKSVYEQLSLFDRRL